MTNSKTVFQSAYSKLNAKQRLAVDTIEGPLMVVAGPGTGKTQTIAMRIANILNKTDTEPSSILALTFTEAGTRAMKSRLTSLIGPAAYYVNITTFHGFCADVIRENPDLFRVSPSREPISDLRKSKLIESILTSLPLKFLKPLGAPGFYIQSIIRSLSDLKREGYNPESFAKLIDDEQQLKYNNEVELSKGEALRVAKNLGKNQELVNIFQAYEDALREAGDYDFDDMISLVADAFTNNEGLLLNYQERYQYFLVDEYQDTNTAQNNVVDLLVSYWGEEGNIFVVGDPNQCVMRFQGASMENILGFKARYPSAQVIQLEHNYRSPQNILDSASDLIAHNGTASRLISNTKQLGSLSHISCSSGSAEVDYIGSQISNLIKNGVKETDIAVIYRNNSDATTLSAKLDELGIGYIIQGGGNILNDPIIRQLRKLLALIVELRTRVDDLDLFTILHYPYLGVDPLDAMRLTRYGSSKNLGLWDVIIDDQQLTAAGVINLPPLQAFRSLLLSWQTFDAQKTATELVETVFRESGLLNYCLDQPDGHLLVARANAFFAEIKSSNERDHELSATSLLSDLKLMEEQGIKIADVSRAEGESAVTLTTAHSSKGLEWRYVFIYRCIDGVWGNNRSVHLITLPNNIIHHQDLTKKDKNEDERRLLYVAITRAKESCTITSAATYRQGGSVKQTIPSMFLLELGSDFIGTPARSDPEGHPTPSPTAAGKINSKVTLDESVFLSSLIKNFRLSPTALNTYLQCAYKFKLNNILKVPRAKAPYLALGTAVHAALEDLYKTMNNTRETPSLDHLLATFDHAIDIEVMRETDKSNYRKKGRDMLSAYYHFYKDDFRPALFMEKFFGYGTGRILLDNDIELAGKVDRIDYADEADRTIRVVDYKTGRPKTRGQIEGKTKDSDGGYYRQLVFYKLLVDLDRHFQPTMTEAMLDFIEPDDKGEFRRYTFTITKEEVEDLKNTIRGMMKSLRALEFPRTTDYKICESCDFLDHCYPNGLPTE